MKNIIVIGLCSILTGCIRTTRPVVVYSNNIELASNFIDVFYSFHHDSLELVLSSAKDSQPNILYYQKWAECGNYKMVKRDAWFEKNDSVIVFPATVKDDLMAALKIDFNVTDTFHITIGNDRITSVRTTSNDLEEYYQAKEWVKKNRPELISKACEGIWEGGPTPCECVKRMVAGFAHFAIEKQAH
ncbi:MAG: hypothetical protein DYG99_09855 [Bacteroidetes bacterium CHB5]|nr:hypothetical protein [Bacteroidetes bacterium CHB5]